MKDDYNFRLNLENRVVDHLKKEWSCDFISTEHEEGTMASYSPIDGMFIKDGKIKAIVENRNRKEPYQKIKEWGGILINYDKITKGIQIAQMFGVPFLFIVYCFNEDDLMYWKIVDEEGKISTKITLTTKVAQKNLKEGTNVKMERNVGILSDDDRIVLSGTNKDF